ncbi:hypothetical protein EYF80_002263 [Liparis tanakae]|uniref:Uncharacterized protein n=1 Tax=Liparis tanakae TaxID=230148 RepID=A0A4Z2JBH0_9TELE|nr:hypothetical protein EYF80_002263 [Liparis tanakae]
MLCLGDAVPPLPLVSVSYVALSEPYLHGTTFTWLEPSRVENVCIFIKQWTCKAQVSGYAHCFLSRSLSALTSLHTGPGGALHSDGQCQTGDMDMDAAIKVRKEPLSERSDLSPLSTDQVILPSVQQRRPSSPQEHSDPLI